MGQNLCKDIDAHDLLIDPQSYTNQYDFQPSTWPDDKYLMKLLNKTSIAPGEYKDKPFKHRSFERYYWGGWINGKPQGKGIYYICDQGKNIYYQGDVAGQPNGIGRLIVNQGQWVYQGEIHQGQAHGQGKMNNKKQGYQFDGLWVNSRPSKGKLILHQLKPQSNDKTAQLKQQQPKGDILIDFDENSHQNVIRYPDGRVYTGQIEKKQFVPHGFGKVVFPDKSQYIGQWKLGQMHGVGKFQWQDGSCYNGDYMFGKRHGTGKFVFNNGRYYNGRWAQGKQNGQGTLFAKDGQVLKRGLWKKGVFANDQAN